MEDYRKGSHRADNTYNTVKVQRLALVTQTVLMQRTKSNAAYSDNRGNIMCWSGGILVSPAQSCGNLSRIIHRVARHIDSRSIPSCNSHTILVQIHSMPDARSAAMEHRAFNQNAATTTRRLLDAKRITGMSVGRSEKAAASSVIHHTHLFSPLMSITPTQTHIR
ncbi:hypothetical protein CBL_03846 [Carabus blaptoides fortunei]